MDFSSPDTGQVTHLNFGINETGGGLICNPPDVILLPTSPNIIDFTLDDMAYTLEVLGFYEQQGDEWVQLDRLVTPECCFSTAKLYGRMTCLGPVVEPISEPASLGLLLLGLPGLLLRRRR